MAKETTVKLSCESQKVKDREFEITHAQALLDKEREMGVSNWKLTDKNFTLNNGTIERANNSADKGAKGETAVAGGG